MSVEFAPGLSYKDEPNMDILNPEKAPEIIETPDNTRASNPDDRYHQIQHLISEGTNNMMMAQYHIRSSRAEKLRRLEEKLVHKRIYGSYRTG